MYGDKLKLEGTKLTLKKIHKFLRAVSRDPQVDRVRREELETDFISAFDPLFLNVCFRIEGYWLDTLDMLLAKYHDQDVEKIEKLDHGQQERPLVWDMDMLAEKLTLQGAIFATTGLYAYRVPISKEGAMGTGDEEWKKVPDEKANYVIRSDTWNDVLANYRGESTDPNTSSATAEAAKTWMNKKYKDRERFAKAS